MSKYHKTLQVDRAFKLVYICTNLRLLDKGSTDSFCERYLAWRGLAAELDSELEESNEQPENSSSSDSPEA